MRLKRDIQQLCIRTEDETDRSKRHLAGFRGRLPEPGHVLTTNGDNERRFRRLACHNKPLMVMTIPAGSITFHVALRINRFQGIQFVSVLLHSRVRRALKIRSDYKGIEASGF